jgi:hypothetical protein
VFGPEGEKWRINKFIFNGVLSFVLNVNMMTILKSRRLELVMHVATVEPIRVCRLYECLTGRMNLIYTDIDNRIMYN